MTEGPWNCSAFQRTQYIVDIMVGVATRLTFNSQTHGIAPQC